MTYFDDKHVFTEQCISNVCKNAATMLNIHINMIKALIKRPISEVCDLFICYFGTV
jgi:hypothetical protein